VSAYSARNQWSGSLSNSRNNRGTTAGPIRIRRQKWTGLEFWVTYGGVLGLGRVKWPGGILAVIMSVKRALGSAISGKQYAAKRGPGRSPAGGVVLNVVSALDVCRITRSCRARSYGTVLRRSRGVISVSALEWVSALGGRAIAVSRSVMRRANHRVGKHGSVIMSVRSTGGSGIFLRIPGLLDGVAVPRWRSTPSWAMIRTSSR